jgi:hypothetical protein
MNIRKLTACLALALGLTAAGDGGAKAATPYGIFAFTSGESALPPTLFENPSLVGVTLQTGWSAVEPQQNVFDWSQLDADVADVIAAGKQVALRVMPGVYTPTWLYAAGAHKLSFPWYLTTGLLPACSRVSVPMPWDPVYLQAWTTFIQALAAHYADNPAVTMIKLDGVNTVTGETLLVYTAGSHSVGAGVCGTAPIMPVTAWQAAGYTPTKVSNAWNTIVAAYSAAFPNQQLYQEVGNFGFPPIDNNGNVIAGSSGDTTLGPNLMLAASETIGAARFGLQNDGLSVEWVFKKPKTLPADTQMAYEAMQITGDATCADNNHVTPCDPVTVTSDLLANAANANAQFVEFTASDTTNPALYPPMEAYGD